MYNWGGNLIIKRVKQMLATKCYFPRCYDLRDGDIVLYDVCVKPVRQNSGIIIFIHCTVFSFFYEFFHVTKSTDSFLCKHPFHLFDKYCIN